MKKSNRILIVLLSLLIAAVPTAFAVRSIAAQLSDNDLLVTMSNVARSFQSRGKLRIEFPETRMVWGIA